MLRGKELNCWQREVIDHTKIEQKSTLNYVWHLRTENANSQIEKIDKKNNS